MVSWMFTSDLEELGPLIAPGEEEEKRLELNLSLLNLVNLCFLS